MYVSGIDFPDGTNTAGNVLLLLVLLLLLLLLVYMPEVVVYMFNVGVRVCIFLSFDV